MWLTIATSQNKLPTEKERTSLLWSRCSSSHYYFKLVCFQPFLSFFLYFSTRTDAPPSFPSGMSTRLSPSWSADSTQKYPLRTIWMRSPVLSDCMAASPHASTVVLSLGLITVVQSTSGSPSFCCGSVSVVISSPMVVKRTTGESALATTQET